MKNNYMQTIEGHCFICHQNYQGGDHKCTLETVYVTPCSPECGKWLKERDKNNITNAEDILSTYSNKKPCPRCQYIQSHGPACDLPAVQQINTLILQVTNGFYGTKHRTELLMTLEDIKKMI